MKTLFRSANGTHQRDSDVRLLSDAEAESVVERVLSWCGKGDNL